MYKFFAHFLLLLVFFRSNVRGQGRVSVIYPETLTTIKQLTADWMRETNLTDVLVLNKLDYSKTNRKFIVAISPPNKNVDADDAYNKLSSFEENSLGGQSASSRIQRMVSGLLDRPLTDIDVQITGINFPNNLFVEQKDYRFSPVFVHPHKSQVNVPTFPNELQFGFWFEERYKANATNVRIRKRLINQIPDHVLFACTIENLHGKVIPAEKYWEKLIINASLYQKQSESPTGKVGDTPVFYLSLSFEGYYASGVVPNPKLEQYRPMEGKYSSALSSFLDSEAAAIKAAILDGLPNPPPSPFSSRKKIDPQ